MQSLVLTKAHQFYPFTGFMDEAGIPVTAYLARHGLPARMLEMPDLYVDETRFWRLSDELARREGLPDFGFQVGRQMRLEDVGDFGSMLMRQASLMEALRTFCIAIRQECYGVTFDLEHHGNHVWLSMHQPGKDIFSPIIELYDLQFMWRIVESALGSKWLPPGLELKADALPAGLREEDVCAGPIRYSSRRTSFAIPVAFLATPMSEYLPHASVQSSDQFKLCAGKLDFATQLRLLLFLMHLQMQQQRQTIQKLPYHLLLLHLTAVLQSLLTQ